MRRSSLLLLLVIVSLVLLRAQRAFANATITIVNGNAPGVGFNDPSPRTPVSGNTGTTLGQQRLQAFQFAASVWGQTIDSPVEIRILATFEPLTCTANSAVLGSAGTRFIFSDFGHLGFSLVLSSLQPGTTLRLLTNEQVVSLYPASHTFARVSTAQSA